MYVLWQIYLSIAQIPIIIINKEKVIRIQNFQEYSKKGKIKICIGIFYVNKKSKKEEEYILDNIKIKQIE